MIIFLLVTLRRGCGVVDIKYYILKLKNEVLSFDPEYPGLTPAQRGQRYYYHHHNKT